MGNFFESRSIVSEYSIYRKNLPELRASLSTSVEGMQAGPESKSAEILNSSLIFNHNEPCRSASKQQAFVSEFLPCI